MRRFNFLLIIFFVLITLVLPMLPSLSKSIEDVQVRLPITLNQIWNPGELSSGHKLFGKQCSACHEKPFQTVRNGACERCHREVSSHVEPTTKKPAGHVGLPCVDCHVDHKGKVGLISHWNDQCLACHAKKEHADKSVAHVMDFRKHHPDFRLSVTQQDGSSKRLLNSRTPRAEEQNHLKFSHKIHLDPKGVSSPLGDTVLSCPHCHKQDAAGEHFEPISMKGSCQQSRCHEIDYAEPAYGRAPHGNFQLTLLDLQQRYVALFDEEPAWLQKCQRKPRVSDDEFALACAVELTNKDADGWLSHGTFGCALCHQVTASKSAARWQITPLRINRDWYPKAYFSHRKHDSHRCLDCHKKLLLGDSPDIAIPGIEGCRKCHADENPGHGEIRTSCDNCHRYHRYAKPLE